jgi:hypothetical protein
LDTIDINGNLSARRYLMPDDYALPGGLRRADFRLRKAKFDLQEQLRQRRELEKDSHHDHRRRRSKKK